jgi:hypothetical protein
VLVFELEKEGKEVGGRRKGSGREVKAEGKQGEGESESLHGFEADLDNSNS